MINLDIIDSLILSKSNRKQITKKEETKNVTGINAVQRIKKDKEKDKEQRKDTYRKKEEENKLIEPKEEFTYKQKEEPNDIYIYKRTR